MHAGQQRERERFARCPDPENPDWGEGEEEQEQKKNESTRRGSRPLGQTARAVALGILSFGPVAYPAWPTLAARAGVSMAELRQGLRELTARRLVQVIPPGPESERLSNEYRCSATLKTLLGYEETETDARQEERPASPASGSRESGARSAPDVAAQAESGPAAVPADEAPVAEAARVPVGEDAVSGAPTVLVRGLDTEGDQGLLRGLDGEGGLPVNPVLTATIRDILSQVAGAPVEVVTPTPRCPALAADEDDCAGGWHRVTGSRSVRRCGAQTVAARKPAADGVSVQKTPLAAQTRTPAQHQAEAAQRRLRRDRGEGVYVAADQIRVSRAKLADLDAIRERGQDGAGAWTTVVGFLFPTETAADAARRCGA